ncbi:MAG: hypothetical protein WC708_05710 [Lentisphaeria bacterium]
MAMPVGFSWGTEVWAACWRLGAGGLGAAWLMGFGGGLAGAAGVAPPVPDLLPPGYAWPVTPRPWAGNAASGGGCVACAAERCDWPLTVAAKDKVYHEVDFDRGPAAPAQGLLRFDAGMGKPWTPDGVAVLLPEGMEGEPNAVAAIVGRRLLLFPTMEGWPALPTEGTERACRNAPEWVLRRQEGRLVLEQARVRRLVFETVDGGRNWRLVRLEHPEMSWRTVALAYDGAGHVVSATLPGNRVVTFVFNGAGLPERVVTPYGEEWLLAYDGNGYTSRLRLFAAGAAPQADGGGSRGRKGGVGAARAREPAPLREYRYTYDPEGRLTQFREMGSATGTGRSRRETVLREFQVETATGPDKANGTVWTSVVRDIMGRRYRFQRQVQEKDGDWRFERGEGTGTQPLAAARVLDRSVMKLVAGTRRLTENQDGKGTVLARYEYDDHGRPTAVIMKDNSPLRYEYDAVGRQVAFLAGETVLWRQTLDGAGHVLGRETGMGRVSMEYDTAGRLTRRQMAGKWDCRYEYGADGLLAGMRVNDAEHRFQIDAAGRFIAYREPGGAWTLWRYDDCGRVARMREVPAAAPGGVGLDAAAAWALPVDTKDQKPEVRAVETRCEYDRDGRLIRQWHSTGREERYRYDCWRLVAVTGADGHERRLRYDANHKLVEQLEFNRNGQLTARWGLDSAGLWTRGSATALAASPRPAPKTMVAAGKADPKPMKETAKSGALSVVQPVARAAPVRGDGTQTGKADAHGTGKAGVAALTVTGTQGRDAKPRRNARGAFPMASSGVSNAGRPPRHVLPAAAGSDEVGGATRTAVELALAPAGAELPDAELKNGLVLFVSKGCPSCNWLKWEWLPEFLAAHPGIRVYAADMDGEAGFKLLLRLEKAVGAPPEDGGLPAVWWRGRLHYGTAAIAQLKR